MTYNEFTDKIGAKLIKIREACNLTVTKMATELRVSRVNYVNNESGVVPRAYTFFILGTRFKVSMNWLFLDIGPMFLPGKTEEKNADAIVLESKLALLTGDNLELLEHMDKIPLLRHEILAQFQRFKEEHPVIVDKAFNPAPKKEEAIKLKHLT